jgi:hypothetical protein
MRPRRNLLPERVADWRRIGNGSRELTVVGVMADSS